MTIKLVFPLRILLFPCLFLFLSPGLQADEPQPLFESSDVLDISLSGPFRTIDRERDKELEYEGTLTYMDNGRPVTLEAKFSVRGNFRLQKDICTYSQLWVDLDKDDVAGTLFENQNKLKLVTQCKSTSSYGRYIVKEHQAYQMFNLITDRSFRSRLLNVTYEDTERGRSRTAMGIFIEHQNNLADRMGMEKVELNEIPASTLDPLQSTLVNLFMYMISNVDFSLITAHEGEECCHNAKIFLADDGTYFPVAYDFDLTGYVSTSYAGPSPQLKQRNIKQRIYRGFCASDEIFETAVNRYRSNEEGILAIADDATYTDNRTARSSLKYMEEFYEIINDPDELKKEIVDECRQIKS